MGSNVSKLDKNMRGKKRKTLAESLEPAPLRFTLASVRFSLWSLFVFSFVGGGISALGAIFVVQIYDRVLPSHSIPTLVVLAILFGIFYLTHGLLIAISGRLSERTGLALLEQYEPLFLRMTQAKRRAAIPKREATRPLDDFRTVISALRGRVLLSVFELAWVPILIAVLGFVSPMMAAFSGAIILLHLLASAFDQAEEKELDGRHHTLWQTSLAREQSLFAPPSRLAQRVEAGFKQERRESLPQREKERDMKGIATTLREVSHSGMLVVGAWLVLTDAMSIGAMMASGMLMMRIIAPVQAILREKNTLVRAYQAYKNLQSCNLRPGLIETQEAAHKNEAAHKIEQSRLPMQESTEAIHLQVSALSLAPPKSEERMGRVHFSLTSGQCLMVTGGAGSGKTLLLKRLCGIVGSKPGTIRIGDEALSALDDVQLSQIIGYLPQDVVFPAGTLLEIISKFDPNPNREAVIAAAKRVGIHEAILTLQQGYETLIAPGEAPLPSTLLRQIAFARVIVDQPKIVLLDDPFRGVSTETARYISDMLYEMKVGGAIILIAMPELIATELADLIMVLGEGRVLAFGSVSEVLAIPPARLLLRDKKAHRRGDAPL